MLSLICLTILSVAHGKTYCQRGQSCWPSVAEVEALKAQLDPDASRILKWDGAPNPRVSSVPVYSPDDQPLYGMGVDGLEALYYDPDFDTSKKCFGTAEETRHICGAAIRNNPLADMNPGIVVFALNPKHIQLSVQFAKQHNMCIMVAGTGHDFINRHSCPDGMFIRTTLLKGQEWDLEDSKGFGWADGNVKVGSGIVFSEVHNAAAQRGRFVASGWAITVGIAGWSIGGGHGPFGNSKGLGVDNILEVDIVTADGELVTANANQNSDLFWAIRGGGGSTWGIITAFTIRAHKIPDGGFTVGRTEWEGTYCDLNALDALTDRYFSWAQGLDHRWSGLAFFTPTKVDGRSCGATWKVSIQYVFSGSREDGMATYKQMADGDSLTKSEFNNYNTYWDFLLGYGLEPIIPVAWTPTGVVSVLLDRKKVENRTVPSFIKKQYRRCPTEGACNTHELYQSITGAKDSPHEEFVSISKSLRTSLFHYVFGADKDKETYYSALGDNAYLSESAYFMGDWKKRLWGSNYAKLLSVKQKYDPDNVFWCAKCVGDETTVVSGIKERLNFA